MDTYTIYKLTNKVNNKAYIGLTKRPNKRIKEHLSGNGSVLIKQATEKYGVSCWIEEIIHEGLTLEQAESLESIEIESHKTRIHGYNIAYGGSVGSGGWVPSKEWRQARSEFVKKNPIPNENWKLHIGMKRSEETKKKLSDLAKKKEFAPNFKGWWVTPWGKFKSSIDAANEAPYKISHSSVQRYCKKKKDGFHFQALAI